MSEGTSVGKIFLELDILADLKSQLESIASKAQGQAKSSFENVGKAASEAMQRPVEKMNKTVEKVTDKVQKTVEECITATGESLDAMVERALKPRNFEVKAKVTRVETEPGAPRGPPKSALAGPDPAEFIANYGKQAKESAIPMSDIFRAAEKLAELLKQKLENLTAQITDQREELLKLENAYAKLGDEGGKEGDKLAQKITAAEGRLISLQQTLLQTQAKYDKAMSGAAQATEKPKEAVASLGEQIKSTLKAAASKGGKSVRNGLGKAFSSMKQNASKSVKDVGHKVSGLGRSIKSAFKSAVLMAGLYAAFRAFRDLIGGALTSNEQFAASLNALKGNLQVAFTPILQVIMPAVNALMSGLALAAQKIAAFTSSVFGKTYAQSVAATKRLKSTSKEAKKAAGAVAGFDQLNNIEKSESAEDSGTNLDALSVDPNAGANLVKEFSDLGPIIAGFLTQALVKIAQFAPKFVQGAVTVLTSFIRGINANFPMISSAVLGIITAFMDGLDQLIPELVPFGVNVITLLVQAFLTYAPRLISAGIALITGLLAGLADKMPELIPMAQDAIRMIVKSLTDNLPQILQSGMEILLALIDGIIEILPELIPTVTLVCWSIGRAIIDNLPQIIQMGVNLLLALVDGFLGASDVIMEMAPQMIETLVKGLIEAIPILLEGAWKLVQALWKYFTETNWAQLGIDIMVALANGVIEGLNTLIGKLNQFDIDVPDWVPVIGGKNISFKLPTIPTIKAPQLPSFASGGIVSQPTLAMVGDNRQSAEAIAPLHELYGMIKQAVADGGTGLTANEIYTAMLNALNDSKFGSQIRLEGDVNIDGRKFARIIAQAVWDEFVRMGRLKPQKI
jgi:uncharacterized protein YukE|nr:MAG TPA: minor tail protein [Bacteriophage sp.]